MSRAFDLQELRLFTHYAQHHIDKVRKHLAQLDADEHKARRLAAQECPRCFYLMSGRICGQGFTEYTCQSCGSKHMYQNTCVPRYCKDCSKKYGICVSCGADLELVMRRKLERETK